MIDYATGESHTEDSDIQTQDHVQEKSEATYVGNKNSMIFHLPDCISVSKMKEKNRVYFIGTGKSQSRRGTIRAAGVIHRQKIQEWSEIMDRIIVGSKVRVEMPSTDTRGNQIEYIPVGTVCTVTNICEVNGTTLYELDHSYDYLEEEISLI